MKILFAGHSLVAFHDWSRSLPGHRVVNLGVAGETVEGLLSRTDAIIEEHPSADLIFLMTGLNNIAMEDHAFFAPYRRIVEKLSDAFPSARIYLHSILPTRLSLISGESIRLANTAVRELAADTGSSYVDIHDLFLDRSGTPVEDLFLEDGVHLSPRGYGVWVEVLAKIVLTEQVR